MAEDFIAVAANVIMRDDCVLLVQEGKDPVDGTWNLPSGRLKQGESPENCAEREAQEETGVNVFPEEVVGVYRARSDITDGGVVVFVYHSTLLGGDPEVPDDDSVQDVTFVPVNKLSSMDLRSDHIEDAVQDVQDGNTYPLSVVQHYR